MAKTKPNRKTIRVPVYFTKNEFDYLNYVAETILKVKVGKLIKGSALEIANSTMELAKDLAQTPTTDPSNYNPTMNAGDDHAEEST